MDFFAYILFLWYSVGSGDIMDLNNFKFKKSFGQNFIKEKNIIEKIINASDIPDNTLIVEIGPGAGS